MENPREFLSEEEPQKGELVKLSPGDYHPGYIDEMLKFFNRPKMRVISETYTWRNGTIEERSKEVPNTPPHFSEFSRKIGVSTRTLKRWAREHTEFREAYQICEEIYEEFLIEHGLTGGYGSIAMKFVAVNKTGMKDKVINETRTLDMNKVLDNIAAGKMKPGGLLEGGSGSDEQEDF